MKSKHVFVNQTKNADLLTAPGKQRPQTLHDGVVFACLRVSERSNAFVGMLSCVSADNEEKKEEMLEKFRSFQHLAELYHVYHSIHRNMVRLPPRPPSTEDPQTAHSFISLLQTSLKSPGTPLRISVSCFCFLSLKPCFNHDRPISEPSSLRFYRVKTKKDCLK